MFTGIIEEVGTIVSVQKGVKSARLSVKGSVVFGDIKLGDSVAVNGVCLTVAAFRRNEFTADVMNETLTRSNLGDLHAGSSVNLERAMASNGRFGGHIVSGHIDGLGHIVSTDQDDNAVWVTIAATQKILKFIVEKGSIAIDGISLTVASVSENSFAVSVIPHTGKATGLLNKKVGDTVNLENDVVGKYIERFLSFQSTAEKPKSTISAEFLANAGF